MGCFNTAGTMSNLSLGHGDKVIFIPLFPNSMNYRTPKNKAKGFVTLTPNTMLVSNECSSVLYCPAFLPIKGEYDDYGSLENIERDANVEYIEEYFGITIDEFMSQVTRNCFNEENASCEDPAKDEILKSLSGMFESRKIYDDMVEYGKELNSAYSNSQLSSEILEKMGFVHNKDKETGDERYKMYYEHPKLKRIVIYCDGSFSNVYDLEKNDEVKWIYGINYLDDALEKMDINLSDYCDLESFKNHSTYFYAVNKTVQRKLKKNKKTIDDLSEDIRKTIEAVEDVDLREKMVEMMTMEIGDFSSDENLVYQLRSWGNMKYCLNEELMESFVDLLNFDSMMFSTNNFYCPAMNGEQHGNIDASEALNKSSLEFLQEKRKEREE